MSTNKIYLEVSLDGWSGSSRHGALTVLHGNDNMRSAADNRFIRVFEAGVYSISCVFDLVTRESLSVAARYCSFGARTTAGRTLLEQTVLVPGYEKQYTYSVSGLAFLEKTDEIDVFLGDIRGLLPGDGGTGGVNVRKSTILVAEFQLLP